ncbi:hypothetical protein [Amaricoccus macauensis]
MSALILSKANSGVRGAMRCAIAIKRPPSWLIDLDMPDGQIDPR